MMNIHARTLMSACLLLAGSWNANATETENLNTRILPVPAKLAIDGKDTVLRTDWNNQKTGLIADEAFELKMEPNAWGHIVFE